MAPCQSGIFLGIGFCTRTCTWHIPAKKLNKLAVELDSVTKDITPTRRELAQVVGKLTWYGLCLPNVSLLTRELHTHIGNPTPLEVWDQNDEKP